MTGTFQKVDKLEIKSYLPLSVILGIFGGSLPCIWQRMAGLSGCHLNVECGKYLDKIHQNSQQKNTLYLNFWFGGFCGSSSHLALKVHLPSFCLPICLSLPNVSKIFTEQTKIVSKGKIADFLRRKSNVSSTCLPILCLSCDQESFKI